MSSEDSNSSLNLNSSGGGTYSLCSTLVPLYMFVVSEMCNTLLGLATNIWSLAVILSDWRRHGAQEVFTINLAVLEILYCLLSLLLLFNYICVEFLVLRISWLVYTSHFFGRSLFQCGLCLERYVAVVHPVFYFKHHFLRCKVAFLLICWIAALWLSAASMVETNIDPVCGLFIITLAINLYCGYFIFHALRRPGPGAVGKKVPEVNLMKKRASYTVLIISACVVVNFLPMFIIPTVKRCVPFEVFQCIYRPLELCCSQMGCFVQPLLFLHRTGKLRVNLKHFKYPV